MATHQPTYFQGRDAAQVSRRGEINVCYLGLPAYHQYAIEGGWNPVEVDSGVRTEVKALLDAGYNVYILWAGPEIPKTEIENKIESIGVNFHVTGIGVGVRASMNPVVVHYLEDLVHLLRKVAPNSQQVFNNGPSTLVWSVEERFPLASDSATRPGKLLGYDCLFDGYKGEPFASATMV